MKKKEFLDLKNSPMAELEKKLFEFREKLRSLSFDLAAGKVKNAREIKDTKKTIARILTILKENKK